MRIPLLLLAAACVAPPRAVPPDPAPVWTTHLTPGSLPDGREILTGFAPLAQEKDWRRGDAALFALELMDGERTRRWLLHLRVAAPTVLVRDAAGSRPRPETSSRSLHMTDGSSFSVDSEIMALEVRVHDEGGAPLGHSVIKVPRDILGQGFVPACEAQERALREGEVRASFEAELGAISTLLTLLDIVQDDPVLSPILWEVVETPSVFSVIANFGVSVTLGAWFSRSRRVHDRPEHLPDSGPTWAVPVQIEVNDSPALLVDLLVTASHPPFAISGGVVGIRARHPTREDLRFAMSLLAAQRGPPATATFGRDPAFRDEGPAQTGR